MTPMNETTDKAYYEGWHDGYMYAIEDVRQELLTLDKETETYVSIEIYETLNRMKRRTENE